MVPCSTCQQSNSKDCFSHLISKLQLVGGQHNDVIVNGQNSLRFDLIVGEEAVTELVLVSSHNFERDANLRPKGLCQRSSNAKKLSKI